MFNPYLILGLVIFWLVSVAGAFWKGDQYATDKARATYATQLEASIKEANENAQIDAEAAIAVATKEANARARASVIRSNANETIRSNPAPAVCRWDDKRFGLLASAIESANSDNQATPGRLSNAIDQANETGKPR